MNLNHLALFLAVAEEGSVSRGAARLHVSQPAVSKQLAEFESALGVRLFDRVPRGVRLTEAGDLLLVYARRLFDVESDAKRALAELHELERGRLSVGASTTIGSYLLPDSLACFHRQHPHVDVELRIGNTEEVQAALREGAVDIGFTEGFAEGEDLIAEVFHTDELVAVAAPDHPLARDIDILITGTRLVEEAFVVREAGSGTRAVVERALAGVGAGIPRAALTLSGTEAIKRAVMAGAGVAVVSRLTVEEELEGGRLALLPLADDLRALLRRPLHRLRLRNRHEGRAVRAFTALLRRP